MLMLICHLGVFDSDEKITILLILFRAILFQIMQQLVADSMCAE